MVIIVEFCAKTKMYIHTRQSSTERHYRTLICTCTPITLIMKKILKHLFSLLSDYISMTINGFPSGTANPIINGAQGSNFCRKLLPQACERFSYYPYTLTACFSKLKKGKALHNHLSAENPRKKPSSLFFTHNKTHPEFLSVFPRYLLAIIRIS